jgi:hypothetical protein
MGFVSRPDVWFGFSQMRQMDWLQRLEPWVSFGYDGFGVGDHCFQTPVVAPQECQRVSGAHTANSHTDTAIILPDRILSSRSDRSYFMPWSDKR